MLIKRTTLLLFGLFSLWLYCSENEYTPPPTPDYPDCPEVQGTSMNLREKANHYDSLAENEHLPDGLIRRIYYTTDLSAIESYDCDDNAGFWTSIYLVSQVFRYKVTGEAQALNNVRVCMKAIYDLSKVTGIPGLWSRCYAKPGLPYSENFETERWMDGEGVYAGWKWKNDVSQDEYSGDMFAVSVVLKYIDDPEILGWAKTLAEEVANHLIDNQMEIIDYDGEPTTFGKIYPTGAIDFPGFSAMLGLSWIKTGYAGSGDRTIEDYYRDCLLRENPNDNCRPGEKEYPFYMDTLMGLYNLDCKENYNNFHMTFLAMWGLIAFEKDRELLNYYRDFFENNMWQSDKHFRDVQDQKNPYFTFLFGSHIGYYDVADQTEFMEAINDGICTLKIFPETKAHLYVPPGDYPFACYNRFDDETTFDVVPINETRLHTFAFKSNPYNIPKERSAAEHVVEPPVDYLAAYWMGRFYGFISEDM